MRRSHLAARSTMPPTYRHVLRSAGWSLFRECAGISIESRPADRHSTGCRSTDSQRAFPTPTSHRASAPASAVRHRLLAFYNYSQGFRPPLLDEAFTQFSPGVPFGRCNSLNLGALAPPSGICGDLYQPEESTTQEVGLSYTQPNFWREGTAWRPSSLTSATTPIICSSRLPLSLRVLSDSLDTNIGMA